MRKTVPFGSARPTSPRRTGPVAVLLASAVLVTVPAVPLGGAVATEDTTCVTTAPIALPQPDHGAVLADGSSVLAVSDDGWQPTRIDAVRLLPDGRLDHRFGGDGRVQLPLPAHSSPAVTAVVPDGDGVLVVVTVNERPSVFRLTSDGQHDTSWSSIEVPGVWRVLAAELDAQGRLLLLGSAAAEFGGPSTVARVARDGRLDPAYGEAGLRELSHHANQLGVAGDDVVVAAVTGASTTYSLYVRLTATGQPDQAWGSGGERVVQQSSSNGPPAGTADRVLLPLLRDSGPVLLAVGPDGAVDAAYGDAGSRELPVQPTLLDEREDGGLLVVGPAEGGGGLQWLPLDSTGALETAPVPSGVAQGRPLDLQADGVGGRLLVADGSDAVVGRFRIACDTSPPDTSTPEPGVRRLAGADRFATAAAVSRDTFPDGAPTVFVGTGGQFPDALAGGPAAAHADGPLLLSTRDRLPAVTVAELERLRPGRVVALGGPAALSSSVLAELEALAPNVQRLSGADRYATAAAISAATFPPGLPTVYLATGLNFPDALAGGALAGAAGAPILLTGATSLPPATLSELRRLRPGRVAILGGRAAVSDAVGSQVERELGVPVDRLSGADRYATSAEIADEVDRVRGPEFDFFEGGGPRPAPDAFVVTGLNFPDALSAGPAASRLEAAVLLASPDSVTEPVRANLASTGAQRVTLLGGTSVLSLALEQRLKEPGYYGYTNYYDQGHLIRWNPCEAIRWRYNPAGAPVDALPDVQEAIRRISEASGLSFAYAGLADEPLPRLDGYEYQPQRYGDRWAPLLIGWDDFDGDDLEGQGGFAYTTPEFVAVSGSLALNPRLAGPPGFQEGGLGRLVLHELGHVVGLGHVRHASEIMYTGDLGAGLGDGDRAGLRRVGRPAGCLRTPEPRVSD